MTVGWTAPALGSSQTAVLGLVRGYERLPAGGNLDGISCAAVTDCAAVGQDGNGQPAYATESAGEWGAVTDLTTPESRGSTLSSVSCASTTACTAVGVGGSNGHPIPIYMTETSGTWSAATGTSAPLGWGAFLGVSCSGATDCTAVGYTYTATIQEPFYAIETAGTWGAPIQLSAPGGGGRLASVSCTDATGCTAVGFDSKGEPIYSKETAGTWGAVKALTSPGGDGQFTGVSCSSASSCTAVGYSGTRTVGPPALSGTEPLYATESAGTWGTVTQLTAPGGNGALFGVSCSDATDCTAVGQDVANNPVIAIEGAGSWGPVSERSVTSGGQLDGVSCTTSTDCTAAGAGIQSGTDNFAQPLYATESAGTWGPGTELSTPGGGQGGFTAVSCSQPGDCTAVGNTNGVVQPFRATEVNGTWGTAVVIESTGDFYGVSCTDARDCTAVGTGKDGEPMYATESAGTWGPATELAEPGGTFLGVSCSSASDCAAVGSGTSGPIYATESAGTWGPVTELPVSGGRGALEGVSCSSAADCTAVGFSGGAPAFTTESSGTWGPLTALPSSTKASQLYGVSCWSANGCTAVGTDGNPVYVTESAGSWGSITEVPEASVADAASLVGVSCVDSSDCTAVGTDTHEYIIGSGYEVDASYWLTATESSGSWGQASELPAADPLALPAGFDVSASSVQRLGGVSCTSVTVCEAVGDTWDGTGGVPASAGTVPGRPVIGAARIHGRRGASLRFGAPPYDGGAAVTGYVILESTGKSYSTATTSPPCTIASCTVTGLQLGRSYRFEVEAMSESGAGPPSAPSNPVATPATVPGEPSIGKVTGGNKSATARWSPPSLDGGAAIRTYTARAKDGTSTFTCVSKGDSCTIHGLENGRTYEVSVVARNSVGTSPRSAPRRVIPRG
jgi:hypothetical protein